VHEGAFKCCELSLIRPSLNDEECCRSDTAETALRLDSIPSLFAHGVCSLVYASGAEQQQGGELIALELLR